MTAAAPQKAVRRQTTPTQATVTRYLKAARAAGVEVAEVRIEPDGTIRVLAGDPAARRSDDAVNPWDSVL